MGGCNWFYHDAAVWKISWVYLDVEFCIWHRNNLFVRVCIQLSAGRTSDRANGALYGPGTQGLFEGRGAYRREWHQPFAVYG